MNIEQVLEKHEIERIKMYEEYKKNLKLGFLLLIVLVGLIFLIKASMIASSIEVRLKEVIIKDMVKANYEGW